MSIVFSDLTGSTSLGERLDQEVLPQVMARYFEEMNAALTRHGGTVEKYIGDAVMAVFGLPVAHEEDALRAVRAASEMRTALEELNQELEKRWGVRLQARMGVNSGEVVTQEASGLQTFMAADCVNVAARLEQAAQPGEILIGEPTYRQVRDVVVAEPIEPLDLKGKRERVAAYRLREVLPDVPGISGPVRAALVGRDTELGFLESTFNQVVESRTCHLLTIVGEAGLGKSRLARELVTRLGERATVLYGRCLSYGEGITFWPLAEAVKSAAGILHADSSEHAAAKLAWLAGEEAEETVPYVASAIGLDSRPVGIQEAFWATRKLFESIAGRRPLVLVFDNVQWAEPTFLDFIEYLHRSIRMHPLVVLCLARPELLEAESGWSPAEENGATLELKPLGSVESRLLIEGLLGSGEVGAEEADQISAAAGGNPLFLTELVEMLVEEGRLELRDGRWTASEELSGFSLPPTIGALVGARLDSLEADERALLERASVIGYRFSREALLMLYEECPPAQQEKALSALERKGFVRGLNQAEYPGLEGFRFAHNLVREGTYNGVLKQARADLHQRIARWIEGRAGERVAEYQEILGYHLERAYRYTESLKAALSDEDREMGRDASKWLGAAGRRALSRGDTRAAVKLLERAIALLPDRDPGRADLLLRMSIAFAEMGEHAEADAVVSERIAAEHLGRPFLAYRDGQGRQQVFDFERAPAHVALGRRSENDISLGWDGEVSRVHAILEREGDAWVISDEGLSRNGTFVNGARVTTKRRLLDGDVLRLGDTILLYREPAKSGFHAIPGHSHASTLANGLIDAPELSESERLVLGALCRSWAAPAEAADDSAEERVARELEVGVDEVNGNLQTLFGKLEVDAPSHEERLAQLVARALGLRLVAGA